MIRAAAKNHSGVAVVVKPEAYDAVLEELRESGGEISAETRQWLANEAFAHTAAYDAAISRWFGARYEAFPEHFVMSHEKFMELPYGENPHQKAALYVESAAGKHHVLAGRRQAARQGALVQQHPRPRLGAAAARRVRRAGVRDRQAQQPLRDGHRARPSTRPTRAPSPATRSRRSAACCVFNRPIDGALAERLHQQFIEVLLAPGFEAGAMEVLTQKEAIRILEPDDLDYTPRERDVKRVRGGLLVQEPDRIDETRESMTVPTAAQPTEEQWADLLFAWKVCRHVRSNAIVFAKDGATVGIGAGQMSRVDSVRIAIEKAREAFGDRGGASCSPGSVVASDAFFPFPDGPQAAMRRRGDGADPARRIEARRRGDRRLRRGRRRDGLHRPPPLPPLMGRARAGAATLHVAAGLLRARRRGRQPARRLRRRRRGAGGRAPGRRARPGLRRDRVRRGPRARGVLRIFTPEVELPLAGHPLVGTAWLLRERGTSRDGAAPARRRGARCASTASSPAISADPEWGPPFEFVQLGLAGRRGRARRAARRLRGGRRLGLDRRARRARSARGCSSPEAGVDEDEATGSAALRLCAPSGARSRSARAAARCSTPARWATGGRRSPGASCWTRSGRIRRRGVPRDRRRAPGVGVDPARAAAIPRPNVITPDDPEGATRIRGDCHFG